VGANTFENIIFIVVSMNSQCCRSNRRNNREVLLPTIHYSRYILQKYLNKYLTF